MSTFEEFSRNSSTFQNNYQNSKGFLIRNVLCLTLITKSLFTNDPSIIPPALPNMIPSPQKKLPRLNRKARLTFGGLYQLNQPHINMYVYVTFHSQSTLRSSGVFTSWFLQLHWSADYHQTLLLWETDKCSLKHQLQFSFLKQN